MQTLYTIRKPLEFLIFGNNIEDVLENRFIIFLFMTGLFSMFAHVFLNFNDINPIARASGIVSVNGCLCVFISKCSITVLVPFDFYFQQQ